MYSVIVPITKENILSLVTPYDIFRKYIPGYEPERSLKSPLHKDQHPSFWSKIDGKGNIWFKDYSKEVSGDCFTLVMELYNCDFIQALHQINADFNLGLGKSDTDFERVRETIKEFHIEAPTPREAANIQIASRKWELYDLQFWAEYGVSYQMLEKYKIQPINFYWIRDFKFRAHKYAYSWMVYDKRKIYQPYDEYKWTGDLKANYVQGLQYLPKYGKNLIIQSSLKDIMAVEERYSIPGIAGSSETTPIPDFILDDIDRRFENIYVLHDADSAGLKSGTTLAFNRKYVNILLPEIETPQGKIKDPSDYIKSHNASILDSIFKLYNITI